MKPCFCRFTALLVLSAGLFRFAAAADSEVPFRSITFDAAQQAAASEGKLIFIDFYTTWCEPCKRLDATTWTDAAVGKLVGDKAVALKIDAEKEGRELAKRYKVDAYPTLLLLKADGTLVDRMVGFMEPKPFREAFTLALAGKTTLARAVDAVAAKGDIVDHDKVEARYKLGQTLARQGDQARALLEFLWCFDEGMVQISSYRGVRTSFLLSEIGRLAKNYPPAQAALIERCDAAERRMEQSASDRDAISDFAALCAALGDEPRMMAVFDRLPKSDARRRAFGLRAYRVLLGQRRYVDALDAMPYKAMTSLVDSTVNRPTSIKDPRLLESMQRNAVNNMLEYVEVLAGAGDLTNAKAMMEKLLAIDASAETKGKMKERLNRAGQPDLGGSL